MIARAASVAAWFLFTVVARGADELPAVPAWMHEKVPEAMLPFVGKPGLPDPWPQRKAMLGNSVAGVDRWQANKFIVHRPETAAYLNSQYSPTKVDYVRGTFPAYEKIAEAHTAGLKTDREKAIALLTKAMPAEFLHPTIPPAGPGVRADRGLADEPLLASKCGFCNEQSRVFVRLCQVLGIPARMIFLFYADGRSGHVVAEFHADGRWSMADTSWFCVFPDDSGKLLSTAELHADDAGKALWDKSYKARYAELLKLTDEQIGGRAPARLRKGLTEKLEKNDQPGSFGVLNYPLPQ